MVSYVNPTEVTAHGAAMCVRDGGPSPFFLRGGAPPVVAGGGRRRPQNQKLDLSGPPGLLETMRSGCCAQQGQKEPKKQEERVAALVCVISAIITVAA